MKISQHLAMIQTEIHVCCRGIANRMIFVLRFAADSGFCRHTSEMFGADYSSRSPHQVT